MHHCVSDLAEHCSYVSYTRYLYSLYIKNFEIMLAVVSILWVFSEKHGAQ